MATTYGYGGEFSSDEDIDKLDQQVDRMVQAKYDNSRKPVEKRQIEDLIGTIKNAPYDQDFQLSDDFLAGLLDYYKTPRGPIVDSTRKLYHKIALRLVRGDQPQGDDNATNGNSNFLNNNNNNNNSINITHKVPQQSAEAYSSDDDDEPVVVMSKSNLDSRTVYTENDENSMEVDSETPAGPPRETKQVDLSSTDEDSESSDDSDDSEELTTESDVLDATPIKSPANPSRETEGVEALMAARPATPKQQESAIKRQPLAQSTPKEKVGTAKKPYTRSQRVATRSATRSSKASETSAKSDSVSKVSAGASIERSRYSSKKYVLLAVAILVVVLAALFYNFRTSIGQPTKPIISF